MLVRCLLRPTSRRLASTPLNVPVRQQASPSAFANVEKSLTQNLLVFEYKDRLLPFLGGVGLLQFAAFGLIAYWSFHLFGTVTAREDRLTSDSTLIDRAATIVPTARFRYATNGSIVLLSELTKEIRQTVSFSIRWSYLCCLYHLPRPMHSSLVSVERWRVGGHRHLRLLAQCTQIHRPSPAGLLAHFSPGRRRLPQVTSQRSLVLTSSQSARRKVLQ